MPDKKQNSSRRNGICVSVIILTLLTTMLAGGVIAKYIKGNLAESHTVYAKEFYFTSNMLSEKGAHYTLNSNIEMLEFDLGNNADLLRYSDDEIEYKVVVDGGALLNIKDNAVKASEIESSLTAGNVSTHEIQLSGLEPGKTYTVTATGTAGYSKTLSAVFKVLNTDQKIYKHINTENDEYVLLTIWTENLKGNVTVEFPDGLIPDNTDQVMKSVNNYQDGTYAGVSFTDSSNYVSSGYSSHTYRFFRENEKSDLSIADFNVKLNDTVEALPGTPK